MNEKKNIESEYLVIKREIFECDDFKTLFFNDDVAIRELDAFINKIKNENRYIVINIDEPYADIVLDIIIAFEKLKENMKKHE